MLNSIEIERNVEKLKKKQQFSETGGTDQILRSDLLKIIEKHYFVA